MKRLIFLAMLLAAAGPAILAQTVYVSPDVPTRPNGPPGFLPWDLVEHVTGGAPYTLQHTIPGDPAVDALHKMDAFDNWLFSVGAANDLDGNLPDEAEPRDVVLYDGGPGVYSLFFDGDLVIDPVPPTSNIDAIYLDPDDGGDLIVSFDVSTTISGVTFQPSELVRYTLLGAVPTGWSLVGSEIDFAVSTPGYRPRHANVTGADLVGGDWVLVVDIPTRLAPWGSLPPPVALRGQVVRWDGVTWTRFLDMQASGAPGWPNRVEVDALSCQANPGRIDSAIQQITLDKSGTDITMNCPGSCSSGAEFYGLYEGAISSYYSHVRKPGMCQQVCPGAFTFTPAVGSSYYLLVPNNVKEEGSYGTYSASNERPQAALADRCVAVQTLTDCP